MIKPSRILLAIDGTQGSFRAAHHAALMASLTGAEVILLHCAVPHSAPSLSFPECSAVSCASLHERVGPARDILQDHQVRYMEHTVEGPAAESILGVARREHCDLIVMSRQGTGDAEEQNVNRTAEHVVRRAPCTVMVAT